MAKRLLVFTDLDGTLLDLRTYSFSGAREALRKLKTLEIPVIIASNKTRKEIGLWQGRLDIEGPFIAENGGGVYVPAYFPLSLGSFIPKDDDLLALELGRPYGEIREAVESLRGMGFAIRGFGDMTVEEVAHATQMSPEEARLAKEREFSEPCLYEGDLSPLADALKERGLTFWKGGRFIHIQGNHDKGRAMEVLVTLFEEAWGDVFTVALGDSHTDLPMLMRADWPVVIRRPRGLSEELPALPSLLVTEKEGSEGWGEAVEEILRRFGL